MVCKSPSTLGKRVSILFAIVLLVVPTLLPATAGQAPPEDWPPSPLLRSDPDGGATLTLWLDDGVGGTYDYLPVQTTFVAEELRDLIGPEADVADVKSAGYFRHAWTHAGAPMVTLGTYVEYRDHGPLRVPLVIFENQDAPEPLLLLVLQVLQEDLLFFGQNQAPFVLNWAFPDVVEVVDGPTTTYGDYEAYPTSTHNAVTHPTVYAWLARKATGDDTVWAGLFLERTGSASGDRAHSEAEKRTLLGAVTRSGGTESKTAGVYVDQEASHDLSGDGRTFAADQHTDYGVQVAGQDLLAVRFTGADDRSGADFRGDHESRTDIRFGLVGPDGEHVPLVQGRTEDERHPTAGGQESQERTTSLGVVAPEIGYVPLAGTGYRGDNSTFLIFPQNLYFGGLFAGEETGDAEWSLGTFVGGAYQPLLALWYRDDVPGATKHHQGMVSIGTYGPNGPVPVLGVAYEGDRLAQGWMQGFLGGGLFGSLRTGDMRWSVGTFVDGTWTPFFGVEYLDHLEGWAEKYDRQAMVRVGTYEGLRFVPLYGFSYDGEEEASVWTAAFTLGGTFGAPAAQAGRWEVASGPFVDDRFVPVFGMQYQPELPGGARAHQSLVSVGTYVGADYQPAIGIGYDGDQPFSVWAAVFQLTGTLGSGAAGDWTLEVGTFLPGQGTAGWTPLAYADYRNDFAEAQHARQSRIAVGLAGPEEVRADLVALTYEGRETLGVWLHGRSGEDPAEAGPWTVTAGPVVHGRDHPVLGVRYTPEHGAPRAWGERIEIGLFPGDRGTFLPVLVAQTSSDTTPYDWVGAWVTGGTFGADPGELQVTTTAGLAVRYTDALLVVDGRAFEGFVVGVQADTGFLPVAGAGYRDDRGADLLASVAGDDAFALTVGVFVEGAYTPLASPTVPSLGVVP